MISEREKKILGKYNLWEEKMEKVLKQYAFWNYRKKSKADEECLGCQGCGSCSGCNCGG